MGKEERADFMEDVNKAQKGYVITHTHWDREWKFPIWESRLYLAEMMDELLEVLEREPDYRSFLFDGQCVFLEDYLLLRPEMEERVRVQIEKGRLLIGPWYTLPDLFPISGESIIRNLLKGDRVCRKYGHKLQVGYESFGWGKPSQFPQIYKGFGIQTAIVAKYVSEKRAPDAEFIWEGRDGTRILATRLGTEARANFYMHTYMEAMSGRNYKSDEFRFQYGNDRFYHRADPKGSEQDYFFLEHGEHIHREKLKNLALKSWEAIGNTRLKEDRILMDGSDSTSAQPEILKLIDCINEALEDEGITLCHSSLEEYTGIMEEKLDRKKLITVKGELRDGPAPSSSANALMTRYPLKKKNREAQSLLFYTAEPMAAGMLLSQDSSDQENSGICQMYLEKAREYLLLSHSHDSINGVTQDKTARDVSYRLEQCLELADCVKEQVMRQLVSKIWDENLREDDILLLLVNPLPFRRREILRLTVDTPREKAVWDFKIRDVSGNILKSASISRRETAVPVTGRYSRPEPYYCDRHEILLDTGEIPAGGYKTVKLADMQHFQRRQKFWPISRKTNGKEIAVSPVLLENGYLRIRVLEDGCITMEDKKSGYSTGRLNYLVSEGDVGDYWIHCPPYHNEMYTGTGRGVRIWLEENTELQASVCTSYEMEVPAYGLRPSGGIDGESGRSRERTAIKVKVTYTLKSGERAVDVRMEVENTAADHRMSVKFDTGILAAKVQARGHFCVDERPLASATDEEGMRYPEMDAAPMQGFVDITNGKQGFGCLSQDLGEYDASVPGILSCTLFRAVRNIICTEFRSESSYPSQEGGQLKEKMEYRYQLMLHTGNWEEADMENRILRLMTPVQCCQFCTGKISDRDLRNHSGKEMMEGSPDACMKSLPASTSFYEITGAVVSAIKQAEDGQNLILRVYNPYREERTACIRFARPIKEAWETDMKEERLAGCVAENGGLEVTIQPDKIKTYEIIMGQHCGIGR